MVRRLFTITASSEQIGKIRPDGRGELARMLAWQL